jgi:hypothetical protein
MPWKTRRRIGSGKPFGYLLAKTMPSEQRAPFQSLLALIDLDAMARVLKQAVTKNFSCSQLRERISVLSSPQPVRLRAFTVARPMERAL